MPHLLEMEGISKAYPGVQALSGVDFALERGEIHALCGKNGAGKSTLIRVLGGVVVPDGGRILLDGEPVALASPAGAMARGIAVVHQELSLVPGLAVAENLFLGRPQAWLVRRGPMLAAARAVLSRLDSAIDPAAPVASLSIAQAQTVEIAKALAREPRILVLDEPTSALAEEDAERLLAILRRLAGEGVGIVYISHRLAEVERVADRVTVLRDGRTVASLETGAVDRRRVVELMLGEELSHDAEFSPRVPSRERVILRVRGLARRGVVEDVSFDLYEGEILGIAGLVGAGRTELVRLIFGVNRPDAGRIELAGRHVARPTPRAMRRMGVGFLPEDRKRQGLVLGLPVRENLSLAALGRISRLGLVQERRERTLVESLVRDLQVACASPEVPAGTLSGGNQQKIVIGKWLARDPRVLILDEPTRGIDVQAKAQIFRILERLAEAGVAVLFISSELEEVMVVSHRILTMAGGRIVRESVRREASLAEILLSATGAA
jgi:ABC-type sugar transport system ATPase subunit